MLVIWIISVRSKLQKNIRSMNIRAYLDIHEIIVSDRRQTCCSRITCWRWIFCSSYKFFHFPFWFSSSRLLSFVLMENSLIWIFNKSCVCVLCFIVFGKIRNVNSTGNAETILQCLIKSNFCTFSYWVINWIFACLFIIYSWVSVDRKRI